MHFVCGDPCSGLTDQCAGLATILCLLSSPHRKGITSEKMLHRIEDQAVNLFNLGYKIDSNEIDKRDVDFKTRAILNRDNEDVCVLSFFDSKQLLL